MFYMPEPEMVSDRMQKLWLGSRKT